MFIIEATKKDQATGALKLLYKKVEQTLGFLPPHFELFATIDLKAMEEFLLYNLTMVQHPKIDRKLLPFVRLYIAQKECRKYCIDLNTKMLIKLGVPKELLQNIKESKIPLDESQRFLFAKVIKAIYETQGFMQEDLEELSAKGFTHKDFFDLLNYALDFTAKSKMIEIYLQKS